MRCFAFINLLLIEQVWGMISLLLILLLLVLLCLSHLLIMLILRIMNVKLIQLVRTQTRVNLFKEHPLNLIRKRLKSLGPRRVITKSLNKRSRISIITVELQSILQRLTTQHSNNMISFGNQNQFPSSFAPLGDLLKALMFLSNLNSFNSSPSLSNQRFTKRKGSSKVWKEKGSK